MLLLACVAWLAGLVIWTAYAATSYPAAPTAADVLWLAFGLVAPVSLVRMGRRRPRDQSIAWLKSAAIAVGIITLVLAAMWTPIDRSLLDGPAIVTTLAYPVFFVVGALLVVQAALSRHLDLRGDPGLAVILGGVIAQAVAWCFWSATLLDGDYVSGAHWYDPLWTVAMLAMGLGAWWARSAPREPAARSPWPQWRVALPTVILTALLGHEFATHLGLLAETGGLTVLGIASLAGALSLRAVITQREQGRALAGERVARAEAQRVADENSRLNAELIDEGRKRTALNAALARESRRDPLMGIGNRLRLDEDLGALAMTSARGGEVYAVALIDLDRFKQYNDSLGHLAGDELLRGLAGVLIEGTRGGDRWYRYGGDELVLLLSRSDARCAAEALERHRSAVERAAFPHPDNPPAEIMTFSAGVAEGRAGADPDDVLNRADKALYEAKAKGRNLVVRTVEASP